MKVLDSIIEGEFVVTLYKDGEIYRVRGNYPVVIIDDYEVFSTYCDFRSFDAALEEFLIIQDYIGEYLTFKNKKCL